MIRIERDVEFWVHVMHHPAVFTAVGRPDAAAIAEIVKRQDIYPLAAEHGGFLFAQLDRLRRTLELHTAFTPEGWGREVNVAAKEAFNHVFAEGFQTVVTYEMEANHRSRPPRSFGFVQAGEFAPSPLGPLRSWVLTVAAWRASPAYLRSCN